MRDAGPKRLEPCPSKLGGFVPWFSLYLSHLRRT